MEDAHNPGHKEPSLRKLASHSWVTPHNISETQSTKPKSSLKLSELKGWNVNLKQRVFLKEYN